MKAIELDKTYNPKDFERHIYEFWEKRGAFMPRTPRPGEKPYVVVIPPPNVTGVLHLGHGLNNSLQDILVRYHRMKGDPTLWVPGTDHAGIATQNIVEKKLRERGIDRKELGREKFLEETWKVKDEHHRIITDQLKKIGASCDWSRERFTLDEGLSKAVTHTFVTLYERGLIYKGTYLVNWSVGMQSALSDDEVEFKEVKGKLYHLRYPLADGSGFVQVATTRPETMLGDTAVAVHPEDERYIHLIGKMIDLPLTGRQIPVIADTYVDREFGTGMVKITPAHDPNDYEMGKRHGLEVIGIMNPDGRVNSQAPEKYRGMTMGEARKAIIQDFEALELFVGADPHTHQVGHCYRTDTVIEPFLSEQWFVKMEPLAQKALKAWEDSDIIFYPRKWENTYTSWMRNIRDWCISRQLWWGHRIPVWYDEDTGEMIVSSTDPTTDPANAGRSLRQDEDVLDTWFSSWLWPFSVMGWPEEAPDLDSYYPTTALVSGYDIIFFWIARMVMAGMEFTGKAPFRDIYVTGLVRDKKGRKMSKSLGNGIDPLEIVDEYGADALKFTLAFLAAQGQDILLDKETFGMGSRFANKIWNASRYLLMNLEGRTLYSVHDIAQGALGGLTSMDKWILSRLNDSAEQVRKAMDSYRFNDGTSGAYEFFWSDFCDWYIEGTKLSLNRDDDKEKDRAVSLLMYVLEQGLALLHPFLPFITEEIFQKLPQVHGSDRALITEPYPAQESWRVFEAEATAFASLQEAIRHLRTLRSEFTIPPSKKLRAAVGFDVGFSHKDFFRNHEVLIRSLCGLEVLDFQEGKAKVVGGVGAAGVGFDLALGIRESIDLDAALARLEKGIQKEQKALEGIEGRLKNQAFMTNAKPEYVEQEQARAAQLRGVIEAMQGHIRDLST
ncbi:MAG: valine--tRNA ligase [Spirochaetales bacterium]|nr:valine--tRNA ligase [Spirochaetales bacterium]